MLGRLLTISAACGLLFIGVTPLAAQPGDCDPEPAMALIWQLSEEEDAIIYSLSLSADGRYLVFSVNSFNAPTYVARYDRLLCQVEFVSADENGEPDDQFADALDTAISADGQYVAFASDSLPYNPSVFLRNMNSGEIRRISEPAQAYLPTMSADGRYIVYSTYALEEWDDPPGVFLYDRLLDETTEITLSDQPVHAAYHASISADGQFIAFFSNNETVISHPFHEWGDVFLYEIGTGDLTLITTDVPRQQPALSADGRFTVFNSGHALVDDDTNMVQDVYVYDRLTGDIERVSVASDGSEGNRNSGDYHSVISGDGRYVVFSSAAENFVNDDMTRFIQYDVFVHDRETRQTKRVSVDSDGRQVNFAAAYTAISADGRFIAFTGNYDLPEDLPERNLWLKLYLTDWQQLPDAPPDVPDRNVFPTATPTLRWSAITWAAAYEIQIDDNDDFSSPVYHSATLTAAEVTTPELPNGVYYWRVRAQRPNGTWSEWSVVDSFVVDVP